MSSSSTASAWPLTMALPPPPSILSMCVHLLPPWRPWGSSGEGLRPVLSRYKAGAAAGEQGTSRHVTLQHADGGLNNTIKVLISKEIKVYFS